MPDLDLSIPYLEDLINPEVISCPWQTKVSFKLSAYRTAIRPITVTAAKSAGWSALFALQLRLFLNELQINPFF